MASYASVLSLIQTLEQILDASSRHPILDYKHEIESLLKTARNSQDLIDIGSQIRTLETKHEIEFLLEKARVLRDLLDEYSWEISSRAANDLETRIRDAAYACEDSIDVMNSTLQSLISTDQHRVDMEHLDLEEVTKSIVSIVKEVMDIKVGGEERNIQQINNSFKVSSSSDRESSIVGLEEATMQLKDRLTGHESRLEIIPIVGMGGIGKTTLAKKIYHDSLVMHRFDTRGWITVSQQYSMREITLHLLACTSSVTDQIHKESDERLATRLHQSLFGRRYLIVVDDIWSTRAWDDIKMLFQDQRNGSRILITTRDSNIAVYADSRSHHHQMRFLDDDEGWDLLRVKVFSEEPCPPELEEIGKKIVKNCQGLPLTIAVIGGLLSKGKKAKDIWERVAENVSSVISRYDDQCLNILSLSYNYLPNHLRPCFLYMGMFPEDYVIRVSELIKLWDAEGFVKPVRGSRSVEDTAVEYLQDLVDRNLILIHQRGADGKIKSCTTHDLLRDICVKEGQKEKFLISKGIKVNASRDEKNVHRRLSIHGKIELEATACAKADEIGNGIMRSMSNAHSFTCMVNVIFASESSLYFGVRLLRVLNIISMYFSDFPKAILKLYNLRFLACTVHENLPSSISVLENLETLIVGGDYVGRLLKLPLEIWEMTHLKHLMLKKTRFLPDPSVRTDEAASLFKGNLETISDVLNFALTEDTMKRLENVKKLELKYRYVSTAEEWSCYCLNNICQLHKLENLKLRFGNFFTSSFIHNIVPPPLSFPPNLKKLTLGGSRLPYEDMTMIGLLPQLEVLKLSDDAFEGSVWEPMEGEFVCLKHLELLRMGLKHWRADESHFPTLQHLVFKFCTNLEEIPSVIGEIPTLELIELENCLPSAEASAKKLNQEQLDMGNEDIEVRICYTWRVESYMKRKLPRGKRAKEYNGSSCWLWKEEGTKLI